MLNARTNAKRGNMVFLLLKIFVWPVVWLFIKKIEGVENIPKKQFILAANHSSLIDPVILILLCAVYRNVKVRFFATKSSTWTTPFWNFWFNYVDSIRVNGSVDKALDAANKGDNLGIFPEGSRTSDGRVQEVTHTGIGVLALRTGLPVVPVALNTFWFWNRYQKVPSFRRNIKVVIGKPMKFSKKYSRENAEKVVSEVMANINDLARAANA